MSDKLKLLKTAYTRIEDDTDFIAYFLKKYSEIEHLSESEVLSTLSCSEESYYKLALCRVPDVNTLDFLEKLTAISEYSESSLLALNSILKRVNAVHSLSSGSSYLMAARDKKKNQNE